jgi:sulfate transport system permease protein
MSKSSKTPKIKKRIFPGFGFSLGYVLFYLSVLVLIPLSALFLKTASGGWEHFFSTIWSDRVLASFQTTFFISFLASLAGGVGGGILAWVLTRYTFPGRQIIDALVDLPFALPTAVAGIALTSLYAPHGWLGFWFAKIGIKVAFTQLGIFIALLFIGIPFIVRTLQPVMVELSTELEEAAACLGANRFQIFFKVIFPALLPAWITGMLLAFGRAVGEYGSVVFISGNLPYKTEIVPLLIITKLEQYDYAGATAIGLVMLLFSVVIIVAVNLFQNRKSI